MSNCQILQTRVNRMKSDKENMGEEHMRYHSCNLRVTDTEMDLVEIAVYGNVIRPGLQCRVKTVAETMGIVPAKFKDFQPACELPYPQTSKTP